MTSYATIAVLGLQTYGWYTTARHSVLTAEVAATDATHDISDVLQAVTDAVYAVFDALHAVTCTDAVHAAMAPCCTMCSSCTVCALSCCWALHHNTGIPAIGHPEVQRSEGGGGTPCQQVPAAWHRVVCVCPYLMKPHVLTHCCMDLLPFRFCPNCLYTQVITQQ